MPHSQAERKQRATRDSAKPVIAAERVGRLEFRDRQREYLDAATHRDTPVVITEYGTDQVVVMGVKQFEALAGVALGAA